MSEEHCTDLDSLITDADETLEQLELESRNLGPASREKLTGRITSYRKELERLRGVYRSCKREAEERSARIQLLNQDVGDSDFVNIKECFGYIYLINQKEKYLLPILILLFFFR